MPQSHSRRPNDKDKDQDRSTDSKKKPDVKPADLLRYSRYSTTALKDEQAKLLHMLDDMDE